MNANLRRFILFAGFLMFFFSASPAYAYLDPGTGSMIVQAVLAAVAAMAVSLGSARRRMADIFSRIFRKKDKGEE